MNDPETFPAPVRPEVQRMLARMNRLYEGLETLEEGGIEVAELKRRWSALYDEITREEGDGRTRAEAETE